MPRKPETPGPDTPIPEVAFDETGARRELAGLAAKVVAMPFTPHRYKRA